ncbi:MAG TPA: pseudouridine-5'-phosphate glycosidase [Aggregatilineales bacterium]|nr:pseudouridine-5'-phosphate glycosidase [Aggregatilineales bacterium]
MIHIKMIQVNLEVARAIEAKAPVVALESTIIAHGMPYPTNFETALAVEGIVRQAGAVPATIGIVEGQIRVGLSEDEIRFFSTRHDILKAGERDISMVVARKRHAATTAGSSLAIAASAGIEVFVTGGIGGVGPGAGQTFDISADLLAIAGYRCLTVCAGTKAFMDVPATLEYLETQRVPVLAYQADEFPLFYSPSSGCKVDWRADSPAEVAACFAAQRALGTGVGMLLGVPLAAEYALPEAETRAAIEVALAKIKSAGITGKAVTPFLLSAITDTTGGKSLDANIALIKNNARIGAEIAVALAKLA